MWVVLYLFGYKVIDFRVAAAQECKCLKLHAKNRYGDIKHGGKP